MTGRQGGGPLNGYDFLHIGMEIDFHHPNSDDLMLPPETEDLYSTDKEAAAVFIRNRDGFPFSASDLLALHLEHVALQDGAELPFALPTEGSGRTSGWIAINFPEGAFHMLTTSGTVDVRRLRLAVEISVAE